MRQAGSLPVFSIVMPTLNSAATLEAALASIANQDCPAYEVIVSDGASTDGTMDIVSRYRGQLSALTVRSGPDGGVYDAINRGIAVARGEWVYVLGSDDRLHAPTVLSRVSHELTSAHEPMVYGDVVIRGESRLGADGVRYAGAFTIGRLLTTSICQQAIFYRRDLFDRMGVFEARYRILADWHFAIRAMTRYPARWVDVVVCDFAAGGLSARESDGVFWDEYPDLLLRAVARAPMLPDLTAARWILATQARIAWRKSQLTRSALLYAGSLWLRAHRRVLGIS